jgi:glycosyltransferase involved in cell wall biosynthesis
MKILHVIRDLAPSTGGPVTAIQGLATTQRARGHEVVVVATDYGLPQQQRWIEPGLQTCRCTIAGWRYAPQMAEVLRSRVAWADVVHIHTLWEYPTLAAMKLARAMRKPVLLRPCGMLDQWSISQGYWKKRLYLALFSRVLFGAPCVVHFTTQAENEKSRVPGSPRRVVVENGISDAALQHRGSAAFLARFPSLVGKRLILFLSRVHPKKRPDIAIRAFAHVATAHADSVLVVAGPCTDSYRRELSDLAEVNGVKSRVLFTGMLQGQELYAAYRAASLFVLPSMQENFGIAVAEAMAASCPVVVSQNVDIQDYILEANAGIVCAVDERKFATAMAGLLADPINARRIGENGRALCERYFTWHRAAERLDAVYENSIRALEGK